MNNSHGKPGSLLMLRMLMLATIGSMAGARLQAGAAEEPSKGPPPGTVVLTDGYAPSPQWSGQTRAPAAKAVHGYRAEVIAKDLSSPWAFTFLPDGRILATTRKGFTLIDRSGRPSAPLAGVPADILISARAVGLYDVILDRDFPRNRLIYFTYSFAADPKSDAGAYATKVVRARLANDAKRIETPKVILTVQNVLRCIRQAADGTLLIASEENWSDRHWTGSAMRAQQLDSYSGKILRINTDGSIPKDNPFVGKPAALPEIYAYGVRDNNGMTFRPGTPELWVSENGARGGDEINLIEKGKNYGWPVIGYGHPYNSDSPLDQGIDVTAKEGMEQPIYFWNPDVAPAGITFYNGDLFPQWKGNLFVGTMSRTQPVHSAYLVRLVLDQTKDGWRVIGEERLLTEYDMRIRSVHEGPDGALYVLEDGPASRLFRLAPKT